MFLTTYQPTVSVIVKQEDIEDRNPQVMGIASLLLSHRSSRFFTLSLSDSGSHQDPTGFT